MEKEKTVTVIGGGLAGSEAAWQAARRGVHVRLYEMRPILPTGAHSGGDLAELVCSNSLGSNLTNRASGLLKEEARQMGSLLTECADQTALPAGGALAVDREMFARLVTEKISEQPNIEIIREEVTEFPDGPAVIASGPLTSPRLSEAIRQISGAESLFFFDAIAPIVSAESIDMETAFRGSRFGVGTQEGGDYINCPMNHEQYTAFVEALRRAERIQLRDFELPLKQGVKAGAHIFFESCLPVEVLAERDVQALAFGPMRPIGLSDPRTGEKFAAVLQLRQDNLAGSLYNMVGFQTNLTFGEQARVFRMIPGLENAEFVRYGQMHRNTFIAAPLLLRPTLQFKARHDLLFAGQITGIEGYMGNIASGLLAGINAARVVMGQETITLPETTMLGALCRYITQADLSDFQPMKANFGILPPLEHPPKARRERGAAYATRALEDLRTFLLQLEEPTIFKGA